MSLYLVKNVERRLWIAYETDAAQMWVWVPNTGRWHRNRGVEADFYWDQTGTYDPIGAAEARSLMAEGVGRLDGRTNRAQLTRYRDDTAALDSAAVLGQEAPDLTPSPQRRAAAKARAVAGAEPGEWVTWKTYPAGRRQAAYVAANDLRRGKVRAVRDVGEVDTRVMVAADGQVQVQVTRNSDEPVKGRSDHERPLEPRDSRTGAEGAETAPRAS